MDPDPYESPEHDSEVEEVRNFIPKSDWFIRFIFLLPTLIYIVAVVPLKVLLRLTHLHPGNFAPTVTWVIFGVLAVPASIYTANYFRQRDQNSLTTMITMVFIHLVMHAFVMYGAAIVLVFFS